MFVQSVHFKMRLPPTFLFGPVHSDVSSRAGADILTQIKNKGKGGEAHKPWVTCLKITLRRLYPSALVGFPNKCDQSQVTEMIRVFAPQPISNPISQVVMCLGCSTSTKDKKNGQKGEKQLKVLAGPEGGGGQTDMEWVRRVDILPHVGPSNKSADSV